MSPAPRTGTEATAADIQPPHQGKGYGDDEDEHGIRLRNNENNTCYNNTIYSNADYGILIDGENAINNNLTLNTIYSNHEGIVVTDVDNVNYISHNTIHDNNLHGIHIVDGNFTTCFNNTIYNHEDTGDMGIYINDGTKL